MANAVPKLIAYRLLRPVVDGPEAVHLTCREDHPDQLVAQLAVHALDVVISDTPAAPHVRVKVFNHLLAESGTTFFAKRPLARRLRRQFPRSLNDTPTLLPTINTAHRRALDQWFESEDLQPAVTGEFEDSALLKAFGESGRAVFPAPTVIEREVCRRYRVAVVGRSPSVRERYYAISIERRLKHPGVVAIAATARTELSPQVSAQRTTKTGTGHRFRAPSATLPSKR